jgi:uncharacterized oxidoreductase
MNTTNNTILITGGSAGIGLATATLLSEQGNTVIITGRDSEKLKAAATGIPNVATITADITNKADVNRLVNTIRSEFPQLNIVMNNAGRAVLYPLTATENTMEIAQDEMLTNFFSVMRLNELLLPVIRRNENAAIINVSSVVAYVPGSLATYSASKAALHSYTQSLRKALENDGVKVFELMPPLVNTEFSAPIGGERGIPPAQVAEELLEALTNDLFEIRVGPTEDIYQLHRTSPEEAFKLLNPA